ncbi:hypothetical protein M0R45_012243 [Rubus argutus]|uniref:AB hydrolase-1 domain-containing protein n=1 Tax=Rubus argutus TaxID=59490 RepID=A0AAW1YF59_RUBAR
MGVTVMSPHSLVLGLPPVLQQSILNQQAKATRTTGAAADGVVLELELGEIKDKYIKWNWKGQYAINYVVSHPDEDANINAPPILLVHGFDKPLGFSYTMEKWAELILDFLNEVVQKPTVLIGNSVGSLACVIAASESNKGLVRGLVLLNCSGGMNNKAIVDDWRIKLLFPLLLLIDFLLKQRPIASFIFERVRQRLSWSQQMSRGALDAFVSIVTGPPGPSPVQLIPGLSVPILVLWGDEDPFTPVDGPVGKFFVSLPSQQSNVSLFILEGVGHCPHDDRPQLVHHKLLPWLDQLST